MFQTIEKLLIQIDHFVWGDSSYCPDSLWRHYADNKNGLLADSKIATRTKVDGG